MIFRRRPMRWGRMAAIIIAVTLVGAGARAIWANGFFSSTLSGFNGSCQVLARLPGVSDIEISGNTAFLAVSSARGPDAGDGIYALTLGGAPNGGMAKPVKLAGAPKDFHPRGIGTFPSPDGKGLFLMAVNHRSTTKGNRNRFSIDSFEVTNPQIAPALVAEGTIEGGLLTDPQDVVAGGPGTFYVANNGAADNAPMRWLQDYGVIPGGNILYFNGMSFRVMAEGLYGPRSLVLTGDGQHLLVSGMLSRNFKSYRRESFSGTLTDEDQALTLPAGPDRITMGPNGNLLVGAHANLHDWRGFAADAARPSASQVMRVSLDGGAPMSVTPVYGNDGKQIGGASVAAYDGHHLLIGSSLDGRLLSCTPGK
ncbi:MAG: hypothetical protein H6924_05735 [Alphaproteobacteria bacterium]|nr:hypothetical protein [Alphaproteobacteria bacterium]